MARLKRLLFLGFALAASQLSTGCYLGYTNRPILFPKIAVTPARPILAGGGACGCGAGCYREFGPSGCGGSLFPGRFDGGGVSGPVYDAPVGYDGYGGGFLVSGGGQPGCATCGGGGGIPIASGYGGPPIAVTPGGQYPGVPVVPSGGVPTQMPGGPIQGVPYDSGLVPTVKPPAGGSVPLQMPNEVKKIAGK